MRGTTPTLHCDGDDGFCGAWDVDYYAATVSAIDGVPVTEEHRAPGWVSTNLDDFCAEHAALTLPPAGGGDRG